MSHGNTPRFVGNVRKGQRVDFARADIVDWMYVQDGRLKGNFTACVLLAKETDTRARDAFLRKLGMDCSA
ncbi:DUF2314 domain-containing protein [uncultured Methylobacterium sp.]|uniref:DUF2314 domain-containing protein n=1 Tax=uncultured Methylobacterium sp. TaxID=157278 RepID=UPI0035CC2805